MDPILGGMYTCLFQVEVNLFFPTKISSRMLQGLHIKLIMSFNNVMDCSNNFFQSGLQEDVQTLLQLLLFRRSVPMIVLCLQNSSLIVEDLRNTSMNPSGCLQDNASKQLPPMSTQICFQLILGLFQNVHKMLLQTIFNSEKHLPKNVALYKTVYTPIQKVIVLQSTLLQRTEVLQAIVQYYK